ncbi:MAG: hypothetical protein BWK80_17255 [Desulfobacteraceae bacterium IS3]|nr:MAG: hypothetical protein BWK80_17255 [Desulfobacteraceae bacterium IS3]
MKYIEIENIACLPGRKLEEEDTFSFHCHPGLACFNRCCRNLNLFLYPYDVIRLKNRLGITSGQFIDRYSDAVLRPSNFFPEVLLHMAENEGQTCPFLSESGCSVYADRPDTCRLFPVEQGIFYDAQTMKTRMISFFKPPDFCLGLHEKTIWTPKTWIQGQDAEEYHKMTLQWADLKERFQSDPWGKSGAEGPGAKMAFMAIYNIDEFREFVFKSSFLKRYKVASETLKKIRHNDVEILKFGFEWVKFYLWGIKSGYLRLR